MPLWSLPVTHGWGTDMSDLLSLAVLSIAALAQLGYALYRATEN